MAKDKQKKQSFIQKKEKADKSVEYVVTESPMKTWWGKLIVIVILAGMVVLPIVALIFTLFTK